MQNLVRPPRMPRRVIVCATLLYFTPQIAWAGGFEVPDQSAVAGATGGAGTARRGDPASAWYNPAELADGRGFRGGLGVLLAIPTIEAEALEAPNETASTERGVSTPPHLHLAYSRAWWAIGAYVGFSHGSTVKWPDGWWGRFEAMETGIIGFRAAPSFAVRFGGETGLIDGFPDIRLSVGLHVDTFRFVSRRALDFVDYEGQVHLMLWGTGVGGDASIYWQATDALSIALTYQSRTSIGLEGDADFTVPDPFVARALDQHASSEFVVPDRIVIGAAWQQPRFGVFLDVGITLWSVRDRLQVDFESDDTTDIDRPTNWRDSVAVRLGGEFSPWRWLHTRLGFFYDMRVGPDNTLAASSPEMPRVGVTLGLGLDLGRLGADFSYSYVTFLERESDGADAALTRYGGTLHLVGITLHAASRRPDHWGDAESSDGDADQPDEADAVDTAGAADASEAEPAADGGDGVESDEAAGEAEAADAGDEAAAAGQADGADEVTAEAAGSGADSNEGESDE